MASVPSTRQFSHSPPSRKQYANGEINRLDPQDRAIHDWYRFVLSYPPHLVRTYLERFKVAARQCVLDPFCGTGTTLVECKKHGIPSVGIEAVPISHFAAQTKTDWAVDPDAMWKSAERASAVAYKWLALQNLDDVPIGFARPVDNLPLLSLNEEASGLILQNSISPLPLHKSIVLLNAIQQSADPNHFDHLGLAFAHALVNSASNLKFGPEVGLGNVKQDAAVIAPWLERVRIMVDDLRSFQRSEDCVQVHLGDARVVSKYLPPQSVDAVITSPPYPNEKDYTRTTRLESVLLGFVHSKQDLRDLKKNLVRSNTRSVYRDDDDDRWVEAHPEIRRIAEAIETRRRELGKTSGFERLYHRVARLYFGGMARHLADLRAVLKPGARLAYVVGDQASYLQVMIRTGQILADIAEQLGYEVEGIDLFRTRLATATKQQLREEVVILKWSGKHN